jgi:SNF2 family DNA or RNA helicase
MCAKVMAQSRWFLTATPIVNTIEDARHLFMLLRMKTIPGWGLSGLAPLIKKKVLARKMDDIREGRNDLPSAAIIHKHPLEFVTEEEAEFYRGIQGSIARQWKALEEDGNLNGQHLFRLITRLRQISIHPQIYIGARKKLIKTYSRPDFTVDSTKFLFLKELIQAEKFGSHKWLVFCHFHTEMEMLQASLQKLPSVKRVQIYSGDVSESMRASIIEASKDPLGQGEQEILLIQLQAGGVGLNLQHFDRIAFMGPWWTAALMDQAIGRAVRIGQKEQVMVHHISLKEEQMDSLNIDRFMHEKADMKRNLCMDFLMEARVAPAHTDDPVNEDPQ